MPGLHEGEKVTTPFYYLLLKVNCSMVLNQIRVRPNSSSRPIPNLLIDSVFRISLPNRSSISLHKENS